MLYGISPIITPDLMKCLMEMGHADRIILVDANYPSASNNERVIRLPGVEVTDLLKAIVELMPIDEFVEHPVVLMRHLPTENRPEIWDEFFATLAEKGVTQEQVELVDRHDFYDLSKKSYVLVQTGTTARYANILLQKGVI